LPFCPAAALRLPRATRPYASGTSDLMPNSGRETARIEVDASVLCLTALSDHRIIAGDSLGRLHWLDKYPWMARHRDAVVHRVKDNQNVILLISRFLPGLRTAIPIACAYAKLKPLHFSSLNLVSAFLWASTIMLVVTKLGPSAMERMGLKAWWGPIIPALLVLIFFNWLGRPRKKRK